MPINILMPALSPTMESGNLAKWLVKEGDQVSSGDVVAEIETDKATMEVEAVDEGTVAKILVPEGTADVPVNDVIAVLAEEGEDPATIEGGGSGSKGAGGDMPMTSSGNGAEALKGEVIDSGDVPPPTKGYGREDAAPATHGATAPDGRKGGVFASPLARRLARERSIDLGAIKGSGPRGRVVKRDVEAAAAGSGARKAAQPQARPQEARVSDEQVLRLFEAGTYEVKPHDSMRRTIARRIVEAKRTIPHFYLTIDTRIDALLALRAQINGAAPVRDDKPLYKVSVNDMVIKALALALRDVPEANVTWTDEGMLHHQHVDVGVAVAIEGGLITPILRHAEEKPLSALANEMKDLAGRARTRKLKPHEYEGGTTAVSNLGMFGIKEFSAVINPPHATILAVGAGEQRAVVEDGSVAVATMMSCTLSTDHRAVDGALGARLLQAFRDYIEKPVGMLV